MPNNVPDASPIKAFRCTREAKTLRHDIGTRATDISITPRTLRAIATIAPAVMVSPRKISPNTAACIGSVRE